MSGSLSTFSSSTTSTSLQRSGYETYGAAVAPGADAPPVALGELRVGVATTDAFGVVGDNIIAP